MPHSLISISTDFGPGNKGLGVMEAGIHTLCPNARIIRLANDIPGFNLKEGARLFEACAWLPVGFHICVVDPGVGTDRRGLIIATKRGDYLIGPDNGVLIPATRFLGGIVEVHEITNETLMRQPVSPVFHGRDVFAPAAAHLANGVHMEKFGPRIQEQELVKAPYEEATCKDGSIEAEVISINDFGNVFLNVRAEEMHKLSTLNSNVELRFKNKSLFLPYRRTFGEVPKGELVILDDDFGRIEIAVNQRSFGERYEVGQGEMVELRKCAPHLTKTDKPERSNISDELKSLLRFEISNQCPRCGGFEKEEAQSFQNHHIDGNRSVTEYWNLIRVCETCHHILQRNTANDRFVRDIKQKKKQIFRNLVGPAAYDVLMSAYEKNKVVTFPFIARTLEGLRLVKLDHENVLSCGPVVPVLNSYAITEVGKTWAQELRLEWPEINRQ